MPNEDDHDQDIKKDDERLATMHMHVPEFLEKFWMHQKAEDLE